MEPEPQPRILVVEDEKSISLIVRRLLESKLACEIKVADCCDAARRELASSDFELITLDYQLPDGNGLELLEEINSYEDSPPVIMVTGHGDEATAVEAFKLGASGYVVKDKRMATLLVEEAEKALELRRALRALTEREQHLRMLTDNMVDIIMHVDADHRIVYISPSIDRVLGFNQEEMIGVISLELYHPDDILVLAEAMRDSLDNDEPSVFLEARVRHKNGTYVWIESHVKLLTDEDGEFAGAICGSRDVTDRRRSEELVETQRDLAIALSGITDTSSILQLAMAKVLEATGLDCGGVYILNKKTGDLELEYSVGASTEFTESVRWISSKRPQAELVRRGEPKYMSYSDYEPQDSIRLNEGLRFLAAVPLKYEGKIVGSLNVASRLLDDIPEYLKRVLEGFAGLIGQAVGRSSLHAALQESEERYRLLHDHLGQAIYALDSNGVIIDVNPVALEKIGYIRDEIMGRPFLELGILHPDDLQHAIDNLAKIFEGEEVVKGEYCLIKKNGELLYADVTTSAIRDEFGDVIAITNVGVDITEQKIAQQALRQSEEKYRQLYENMGEAVFTYDVDARPTGMNHKAVEMLGYTREELGNDRIRDLGIIFPEDLERAIQANARLFETGVSQRIGLRLVRKDGDAVEVEATNSLLRDHDGEIIGATGVARDVTDQKKSRIALLESEERYRLLYENMGEAVFAYDNDAVLTGMNRKAEELLGFSREEICGRHIADLGIIHPDDLERTIEAKRKLFATAEPQTVNIRYVKKNGEVIEVQAVSTVLLGENCHVTGAQVVAADLTEQKRAKAALRETEERYRLLFESIGQGIYTFDRDGVITEINPAACELIGYSREELLGRHIFELNILHPDDFKTGASIVGRLLSGELDLDRHQYRFIKKNGEIMEVDITGMVRKDDDGNVISVSDVAVDITEQKRAAEALREFEELWRTLIETSPDGIIVIDMQGRAIIVSERAKEMSGAFDGMTRGRDAMGFISEEERATAEARLVAFADKGSVTNVEYTVARPDGSRIVVEASASLIRDRDGEPQAVVAVARDITARKQVEEELCRMNDELRGYAQTVSHDLRGPLASLLATIGLLERSVDVGDSRETLNELLDLLKTDATLTYNRVDDLLRLARAGQAPVDPVGVDVGLLINDVLAGLTTLIEDRNAVIDLDPDLGYVRANPVQLNQIFTNLICNSLRHCNARAPHIEVRYLGENSTDAHKYLVHDNGPGLAPGTEESVFEPFFKGMSTDGTGIGLSIVERIIHAYNGDIKAYNNNGACFEFTLRDAP